MTQKEMDSEFFSRLSRLQMACPQIPPDIAVVVVRRYLKPEIVSGSSRQKQWLKAARWQLDLAKWDRDGWNREVRRLKGGTRTKQALGAYSQYGDLSRAIQEMLRALPPNLRQDAMDGFESHRHFHSEDSSKENGEDPK